MPAARAVAQHARPHVRPRHPQRARRRGRDGPLVLRTARRGARSARRADRRRASPRLGHCRHRRRARAHRHRPVRARDRGRRRRLRGSRAAERAHRDGAAARPHELPRRGARVPRPAGRVHCARHARLREHPGRRAGERGTLVRGATRPQRDVAGAAAHRAALAGRGRGSVRATRCRTAAGRPLVTRNCCGMDGRCRRGERRRGRARHAGTVRVPARRTATRPRVGRGGRGRAPASARAPGRGRGPTAGQRSSCDGGMAVARRVPARTTRHRRPSR